MFSLTEAELFVELLGRSCFSFLRGASQPEELVHKAVELGLAGLALTDLDGMYGAVRAWSAVGELEPPCALKYIVGSELTLALPRTTPNVIGALPPDGDGLTVALLVETHEGYQNLCRLLTLAHEGRDKGQAAVELSALLEHTAGLTALFVVPARPSDEPRAEYDSDYVSRRLSASFGEHFAIATYRHLDGFDRRRDRLAERLGEALGAVVVASSRPRYHDKSRKPLADVLHCIRRGITLDEAGTELSPNAEEYLRSEGAMRRLFRDRPEWVDATCDVASRMKFDFSELRYHFPCQLAVGQTADERLAELTWEGATRRYPDGIRPELRRQVEKELSLIAKIGVAPYFIATREVVEMARRRKILCQGRGSAANSAVCYLLGITAVDPARSNLLFERFLSEERAEPPDIDIDFEHERREEVIQELYATYGRERAAMVSEVIRYRGKSALREVGKVFGLGREQVERLSGTVSWSNIREADERRLSAAGFDLGDGRLAQVLALATELQGFPRHLSIHVGGFVLSSRPLSEVAPIEPARMKGRTVIPWDKDDIDALGFFKVDVLALGMLTAIQKCLRLIVDSGGLSGSGESDDFDPIEVVTRIPSEDMATYDMISTGDTVGVFQIESRAQMAMLPRLRPRRFYDLVVEVAIVRPGPIQGGMVHPYLRRRNDEEEPTCPHPDLAKILDRTLGVPLFQEQVMQIAIEGAGYTGGEADQLRRDMAAWKKHGKLERHRKRLLSGFAKKGISREFGEALFEQIKGFGEYGFPESHASSFALLVYASSWQKCHYPAHFCCALLNSQPMGFYSAGSLVRDAVAHGVEVRDVCVHASDWDSTLEPADPAKDGITSLAPGARRALRLGLRQIRGLAEAAARRIVRARGQGPFSSIEELARRARLTQKDLTLLANSGAVSSIEPDRRSALFRTRAPRTPGLFEVFDSHEPRVELPALGKVEQLVLDYESKGQSLGDHPLRYYRKRLLRLGAVRAADLLYLPKGRRVTVGGLVVGRQRPATASGVVFITLEDETGTVNLIVYSSVFDRYDHVARNSQFLLVTGEVERDEKIPITPRPRLDEASPERPRVAAAPLTRRHPVDGAPITPVIHVIVRQLEPLGLGANGLGAKSALRTRSRDFR